MIKKWCFFVLANAIMPLALSQQSDCNCQGNEDYNKWLLNGLSGKYYTNPMPGFKGERYFGEWKTGTLYLQDGDSVLGVGLRYEKFLDELLFLNGEMKAGILEKTGIKGFTIHNSPDDELVFKKLKIKLLTDFDSADHYLQILKQGTLTMISLRRAVISNEPNTLKNSDRYYLIYKGDYYPIRLKRRDFVKLPFADAKEMKALLRSRHVKVNFEQGMILAVDLYNAVH